MHKAFRWIWAWPKSPPLRSVVCTQRRVAMIVMLNRLTRRAFVARSASFVSTLVLHRRLSPWRTPIVLRVGVLSQDGSMSPAHRLGLELGLDEARHAATLFGGSIVDVPLHDLPAADANLSAIIGGGDEPSALAWIR